MDSQCPICSTSPIGPNVVPGTNDRTEWAFNVYSLTSCHHVIEANRVIVADDDPRCLHVVRRSPLGWDVVQPDGTVEDTYDARRDADAWATRLTDDAVHSLQSDLDLEQEERETAEASDHEYEVEREREALLTAVTAHLESLDLASLRLATLAVFRKS